MIIIQIFLEVVIAQFIAIFIFAVLIAVDLYGIIG